MTTTDLKAFFSAVRKDIAKVCVLETPANLHGKACMVEACPHNGTCEAMMGVSDSLIDHVCNDSDVKAYCANDIAATEMVLFVTREEFEKLKDTVSQLRKDLTTLDRRTASARRYAAMHEKKYG